MALSGVGPNNDIGGVIHERIYWRAVADVPNNRYRVYSKLWLSRDSTWGTHDAGHVHELTFSGGGGSVFMDDMSIYVRDPGNYTGDYNGYQRDAAHNDEFAFWVNCNPDGTCSFTLSAALKCTRNFGSSYFVSGQTYTATATVVLDQIPRAATITSYSNFNIGSNTNLSITNPAGFDCELKLIAGGVTVKTLTGVLSGTISTLITASTLYALTPNNNNILVTAQLKTYYDGDQIGSTDLDIATAYVTNSNPTFSNFTFEDVDTKTIALTDSNQDVIAGYSNIRATITTTNKAVAKNSATMDKYRMTIGSKSVEGSWSSLATVLLNLANVTPYGGKITIEAIDSRGNYTTVEKSIDDLLSLTPIRITSLSVMRDNGSDEPATLSAEGDIHLLDFGDVTNSIVSIWYKYKLTTSSIWITGTSTITASVDGSGHFTITDAVINGDLTSGTYGFTRYKSFDIQLGIADELTQTTMDDELNGGSALLLLRNGEKVILGIGMLPTILEGIQARAYCDEDGDNIFNHFKMRSAGDVVLEMFADTDNANEDDHPTIHMSQDGGILHGKIEYVGNRMVMSSYNEDAETDEDIYYHENYGGNEHKLMHEGILRSYYMTITPVADTPTYETLNFGHTFKNPPIVIVTPQTSVIGTSVLGVSVSSITETSCRVYLYRTNTTTTGVHVLVMEQT